MTEPYIISDILQIEGEVPCIELNNGNAVVTIDIPTGISSDTNFILPDNPGNTGDVLTRTVNGSTWTNGSSGGTSNVWILKDVKSTGTNGGTFSAGAWRTRTLNTLEKPKWNWK